MNILNIQILAKDSLKLIILWHASKIQINCTVYFDHGSSSGGKIQNCHLMKFWKKIKFWILPADEDSWSKYIVQFIWIFYAYPYMMSLRLSFANICRGKLIQELQLILGPFSSVTLQLKSGWVAYAAYGEWCEYLHRFLSTVPQTGEKRLKWFYDHGACRMKWRT